MRDIKFKYVYSDGESVFTKCFTLDQIEAGDHFDEICDCPLLRDYRITGRLQYTGLKDKNGDEMCQGDVIKTMEYPFYGDALEVKDESKRVELNYLGVVGIDPDGCYYDLRAISDRVRGSACGGNLSEIASCCEVISNIYETPELLEVVK